MNDFFIKNVWYMYMRRAQGPGDRVRIVLINSHMGITHYVFAMKRTRRHFGHLDSFDEEKNSRSLPKQ